MPNVKAPDQPCGRQGGLRRKAHRSLYLPLPTERPPGLSTTVRPETRPPSPLSMARLWAFAEQTIPATEQPVAAGSRSHPKPARTRGGGVYEAKRIRSLYLPLLTGRLPGLCTPLRYNAEPHSILSMPRSRLGVTPLPIRPPCRPEPCHHVLAPRRGRQGRWRKESGDPPRLSPRSGLHRRADRRGWSPRSAHRGDLRQ
jgi:hypothetical protein